MVAGVMFSGKSEELIRRVRRAQIARQRVQLFKPRIDARYSHTEIVSHSEMKMPSQVVDCAKDILPLVDDRTEVIGIDEGQFFDASLVGVADALANRGLRVIVAGLDQDFRGIPFGPMPRLMALADEVTKLTAICVVCGEPATRTQRLIDGMPAPADSPLIVIGGLGDEKYEARCRLHHEVPPAAD